MLIRNVSESDVLAAAIVSRVRVVDFQAQGRGFRFKLRPLGEPKRRRIFHHDHKVNACCWHEYGRFMRALFDKAPEAVVISGVATYKGVGEFNAYAQYTGDKNIGNDYRYVAMRDACVCEEEDADAANDWV